MEMNITELSESVFTPISEHLNFAYPGEVWMLVRQKPEEDIETVSWYRIRDGRAAGEPCAILVIRSTEKGFNIETSYPDVAHC
jgi:hypothetical protein